MQTALLRKIETLLRQGAVSATRLGYLLTGDPSFVAKLRRGHSFRAATLHRAKTRFGKLQGELK